MGVITKVFGGFDPINIVHILIVYKMYGEQ